MSPLSQTQIENALVANMLAGPTGPSTLFQSVIRFGCFAALPAQNVNRSTGYSAVPTYSEKKRTEFGFRPSNVLKQ